MNYREESLKKHAQWKGKIEVVSRVPVGSREELSLAYTPGVAEPCMAIHEDIEKRLVEYFDEERTVLSVITPV